MQWKKILSITGLMNQDRKVLSRILLIFCIGMSLLPLNSIPLNAQQLASNPLQLAQNRSSSTVSLIGEAAIEHLRANGQYAELQRAWQEASQGVSKIADISTILTFNQEAYLKSSAPTLQEAFGSSLAIFGETAVIGARGTASVYIFVRNGTTWSQQAQLQASNRDPQDNFGTVVAIDGDTVVVGALSEDSNATGVNGNQNDNSASSAGAAYVFVRNGTTWNQQAYLKASNTEEGDIFGVSVAIFGDTIIVGASGEASNAIGVNGDQTSNATPYAGAAYVFVRNGINWSQQMYLKASNTATEDSFGLSVAISGDTAIIGAPYEDSSAFGINGDQNDNSATNAGAIYAFVRNGTTWSQQAYLKASTPFPAAFLGLKLSLSANTAAIVSEEATYVFSRSGVSWSEQVRLQPRFIPPPIPGSFFINTQSVSISDNRLIIGLRYFEEAYLYVRNGTTWSQESRLTASNGEPSDGFGSSVIVGNVAAIVSAPGEDSSSPGVNGNQSDNTLDTAGATYLFTDSALPTPVCANLLQEAESGNAILTGFGIGSDAAASGGQYINAPQGGTYYNGPNVSYKAEYCFNVPTPGTYRIKGKVHAANDLSDSFYLTVDGAPASGYLWDVLQNSTYALDYVNDRNNADPVEVPLSASQHFVTVYLREQGTRLDTLELELVSDSPPPTCGGLLQEAESGVFNGNWAIGNDAAAFGGAYIHAAEGTGNFWNGANGLQKAAYCFNVPTSGTYRIHGKVYGGDALSDSFYVQVDGSPISGYLWDVLPNTTYASDLLNNRGVADPVEVLLTSGQHTVTVFVREDGTRLDNLELQLVNDSPPPTPVCAGLSQEAESGALSGNFVIGTDVTASGAQYAHTPNGSGDFWSGPNARHKAEYCFNVTSAGTYRIDSKVYGADSLSDSFYVQVDGTPINGYLWDILPNTTYALDSVNDRNQLLDLVTFPLSSGQHTVTVYAREDGARLDTIQLVATAPAVQGRATPLLAKGIQGTIHLDASGLSAEVDFSTLSVTLLDAETAGQTFRQQVQVDPFGRYHFDGMVPGKYIVQLALPSGLLASTSSASVTATADELVEVAFEVSAGKKIYLPLMNR